MVANKPTLVFIYRLYTGTISQCLKRMYFHVVILLHGHLNMFWKWIKCGCGHVSENETFSRK
jgi:hypothetical protein